MLRKGHNPSKTCEVSKIIAQTKPFHQRKHVTSSGMYHRLTINRLPKYFLTWQVSSLLDDLAPILRAKANNIHSTANVINILVHCRWIPNNNIPKLIRKQGSVSSQFQCIVKLYSPAILIILRNCYRSTYSSIRANYGFISYRLRINQSNS